ncbi:MAG TPA: copper resistance protein NlpE N-terminal domain-containing protein [Fimbriimonadaceae bacterium]|nr:copper resistance protein NlpE N-terminal domain-containing protein [Fimbriimonadaceae bacterium]
MTREAVPKNNMKSKNLIRTTAVLFAVVICALANAQNAAGTWTGKMDLSAVKPKDANEKMQVDMMKKILAGSKVTLSLKANKTYHFTMTATFQGKSQTQNEDGKWSQQGRSVTTIDPKGKKNTLTLSADGKKMIMVPNADDSAPKGAKMIFIRA